MTIKNKIGKLSQNIYGWEIRDGKKFSKIFLDEIHKYGKLGYLYGVLRADPWSGVNNDNGIRGVESAKFLNYVQRKIIKETGESSVFVEEAPHGHQALDSTTLPVNLAVGSTFNVDLYKKNLSNIAKEIRYKGAHIALLSCLDLALDPRWGRSEECFGEDTYLSMQMTKNAIIGLQGDNYKIPNNKVAVVAKHFIGQGSALGGHNGKNVSMGWNELLANHLPIAEAAAKQEVAGFMAAYNSIDKVPCHINKKLLNYMNEKNGFKGIMMSDGCAIDNLLDYVDSPAEAIALSFNAGVGVDLWNKTFNSFEQAFNQGLINEETIDKAISRTNTLKDRLSLNEKPYQDENSFSTIDFKEHEKNNLQLAEESIILLKNEGILPLDNMEDACLIGWHIDDIYRQLGDYTPFKDLKKSLNIKDAFNIPFATGTHIRQKQNKKIEQAVELAKTKDKVILIVGSSSARKFDTLFDKNGEAILSEINANDMDCGEGVDVADIKLSQPQLKLINAIYKVNKNIITVVISGRAIGIEEVVKKSRAILQSFYPGDQGSKALLNTLIGKNNPSGRLSVSIPKNSNQLPNYYWLPEVKNYVDETSEPLFGFGFGLSYSEITEKIIHKKKIGNNKFEIEIEISNKSKIDAKYSSLIFARIKNTTMQPPKKQLVGFEKTSLKANQVKNIKVCIDTNWIYENYKYKNIEFELNKKY